MRKFSNPKKGRAIIAQQGGIVKRKITKRLQKMSNQGATSLQIRREFLP